MIKDLRKNLESNLAIPFHYVTITETDPRPCASIRMTQAERPQALQKSTRLKVQAVEVSLYADDYEQLDAIAEKLIEKYDGAHLPLADGKAKVKIIVDDEEDEAYPPADGSDNWIFNRIIVFRVHH